MARFLVDAERTLLAMQHTNGVDENVFYLERHPRTLRDLLQYRVPPPGWVAPRRRWHPPTQAAPAAPDRRGSVITVYCCATRRPVKPG